MSSNIIQCLCGYKFDLLSEPTPGHIVIPNKHYLSIIETEYAVKIRAAHSSDRDSLTDRIHTDDIYQLVERTCASLFLCSCCGRILWSGPGEGGTFHIFEPSEEIVIAGINHK